MPRGQPCPRGGAVRSQPSPERERAGGEGGGSAPGTARGRGRGGRPLPPGEGPHGSAFRGRYLWAARHGAARGESCTHARPRARARAPAPGSGARSAPGEEDGGGGGGGGGRSLHARAAAGRPAARALDGQRRQRARSPQPPVPRAGRGRRGCSRAQPRRAGPGRRNRRGAACLAEVGAGLQNPAAAQRWRCLSPWAPHRSGQGRPRAGVEAPPPRHMWHRAARHGGLKFLTGPRPRHWGPQAPRSPHPPQCPAPQPACSGPAASGDPPRTAPATDSRARGCAAPGPRTGLGDRRPRSALARPLCRSPALACPRPLSVTGPAHAALGRAPAARPCPGRHRPAALSSVPLPETGSAACALSLPRTLAPAFPRLRPPTPQPHPVSRAPCARADPPPPRPFAAARRGGGGSAGSPFLHGADGAGLGPAPGLRGAGPAGAACSPDLSQRCRVLERQAGFGPGRCCARTAVPRAHRECWRGWLGHLPVPVGIHAALNPCGVALFKGVCLAPAALLQWPFSPLDLVCQTVKFLLSSVSRALQRSGLIPQGTGDCAVPPAGTCALLSPAAAGSILLRLGNKPFLYLRQGKLSYKGIKVCFFGQKGHNGRGQEMARAPLGTRAHSGSGSGRGSADRMVLSVRVGTRFGNCRQRCKR